MYDLKDRKTFEAFLFFSSTPMWCVEGNKPVAMGSSCIIYYQDKHLLLTVQHLNKHKGKWSVLLDITANLETKLYDTGTMSQFSYHHISGCPPKDIEFAFAELPESITPKVLEFVPETNAIHGIPTTVFENDLTDIPDSRISYGFCGNIMPSKQDHGFFKGLETQRAVYQDLTYLRSEGDLHFFSLPSKHPGHEFFQGCSGAPIVGNDGSIVALLEGGDTVTSEVWGMSLSRAKLLVDVTLKVNSQ